MNSVTANGNDDDGLRMNYNYGDITLNNVNANDNGNFGLGIYNYSGDPHGNISISNSSFNGNEYRGIQLRHVGGVSLESVSASDNHEEYGIKVYDAFGDIKFNNVTANSNGLGDDYSNLYLEDIVGGVAINNSSFDGSGYRGMEIYNVDDGVSMNGTHASSNSGANIYIDDVSGYGLTDSGNAVDLNNVRANGSEYGRGLVIENANDNGILIANSQFNNNKWTNISINRDSEDYPNITVEDTSASNSISGNGINIGCAEDILIKNVNANYNNYDGIALDAFDFSSIVGHTQALGNGGYDIAIYGGDSYIEDHVRYDTLYPEP